MPAITAGLAGHAVTARCAILPGQAGLAALPLGACGPLRAGLAIKAILARRPIFAVKSGLTALPLRSSSTRLAVVAIEAILARRPVLAVKSGLAAFTLRSSSTRLASGATRPGNTRLAADALGASRSGESRRGDAGETSSRTVLLPEMEIVPAAVFGVPHPKMTGGGVVVGIAGLGPAREAVNVIDKTENAADRGETLDAHGNLTRGEKKINFDARRRLYPFVGVRSIVPRRKQMDYRGTLRRRRNQRVTNLR
jgi:hypothetical protein